MIISIDRNDLPACLEILHIGYETIAEEFGLTEKNCPDRGRASLPFEKLVADFENGTMMFGYYANEKLVGFLGMKMHDNGVLTLDDIVILPGYRKRGYGKELLDHCRKSAKELGAAKIQLGMIDDNKRLKRWYEENGFVNIGYVNYDEAPFTVGRMECLV